MKPYRKVMQKRGFGTKMLHWIWHSIALTYVCDIEAHQIIIYQEIQKTHIKVVNWEYNSDGNEIATTEQSNSIIPGSN